jgi:hypothetical protein
MEKRARLRRNSARYPLPLPANPGSGTAGSFIILEQLREGKMVRNIFPKIGRRLRAVKPDLLVSLAFPKGHKVLVGEIKANGQPRVAREAVNQILRYRDRFPDAYARSGVEGKKPLIGYWKR